MKKIFKVLLSLLCAVIITVPVFITACGPDDENEDFAAQLKLDMQSETKKQEVTLRLYIDGDTTHFDPVAGSTLTGYNAADFADTDGYIKARYLAINTPESTGTIEPWGKKASNFTHDKLASAQSIIVESDTDEWDIDSTGSRYLLWVWYLPADAEAGDISAYRNLNIEILQSGLAYASRSGENRYGTTALAALAQAEKQSLYVFSGLSDPDYYYGDKQLVSLKEVRCHTEKYNGTKVEVEGTVVAQFSETVYIEALDEETGLYFGMPVYYGYKKGKLLEILAVGNRVKVVGTVQAFQGGWQISGLAPYNSYNKDDPDNCNVIGTATPSFTVTQAKSIMREKTTVHFDVKNEAGEDVVEALTIDKGEALLGTSVKVENLTVNSVTTTQTGASMGAMSLKCTAQDGTAITVRTEVLKDKDGNTITSSALTGKVISVKGIVDKYVYDYENAPDDFQYQVKVYRADFLLDLDDNPLFDLGRD